MAPKLAQSRIFPSWFSTFKSTLICQTFSPARIHKVSISKNRDCLRFLSKSLFSSTPCSDCLIKIIKYILSYFYYFYFPNSKCCAAMGERSRFIFKIPSLGRESLGFTISADTCAEILLPIY